MRLLLALSLLLSPLFAQESAPALVDRCPEGATAYFEARGLAGKIEAMIASPLGEAVRAHPAYQKAMQSPEAAKALMGEAFVKGATGHDFRGLLRVLAAKRIGVAVYGQPQRVLALAEVDPEKIAQILKGVEIISGQKRVEIFPADETRPALWRLGPAFLVLDGDMLCASPVQELAASVRNRDAGGVPGFAAARSLAGTGSDVLGWVDMNVYGKDLRKQGKPKNIGEAFLLGALKHHAQNAEWAATSVDFTPDGDTWRVRMSAFVPTADDAPDAVRASYSGTLADLPFKLPENTIGLVRMKRSLPAMWTHREALIAERGIPGLVEFETNFGNLTGGMSWVEQFLPALRGEVDMAVVATRRTYAKDKPAPEVRYPQGAILLPVKKSESFGMRMQIAFQTAIGIINAQQGMMGNAFLMASERYKDTTIQVARYVPPTEGEMAGMKGLPVRYNFEPSAAIVGDYFVVASTSDALKEIIDAQGGATAAPKGVNAGMWFRPSEIRAILAENRDALVAQTMMKEGLDLAAARQRIDLVLDLGRFLEDASFVVEESRASHKVALDLILAPAKE